MNDPIEFIKNCYDNCQGRNYNCGYYKQELLVHFDKTKPCSVYKTIQNDIKKIEEGKTNITYPCLNDLVINK